MGNKKESLAKGLAKMVNIKEMLRQAVEESAVYCPYCEHGYLESDYEKCPECKKTNPLRERGYI